MVRITSGWRTAGGHYSVGGRLLRIISGWRAGVAHELMLEGGGCGMHKLGLEGKCLA